jgi:pimeloyl-ACP methyl ester carboxylesterase
MTKLKSCPGTSIQRAQVLGDVSSLLNGADQHQPAAGDPPATSTGTADLALIRSVIVSMTSALPAGRGLAEGELDYDFNAKTAFFAASSPEAALLDFQSRDVAPQVGPTSGDLQMLRPYAVNMRWGKFAEGDGHLLQTAPSDVDSIVNQHLPAALGELGEGEFLDILLYAHGGLVSEADGLQEALHALPFFRNNQIYPIFFVWETGLWETIQGLITGQAEAETRDLAGIADAIRNKAIEFAAHYVLPGPTLWGGMKWDADRSSQADGAAYYFARGLMSFLSRLGDKAGRVRIHAVGHSAGAIFHSYLLPALKTLGLTSINTFHLLAPAIRIDSYMERLAPLIGNEIGM